MKKKWINATWYVWSDLKKMMMIMRLIVFLVLFSVMSTIASDVMSQNTQIKIKVENATLESVLKQVREKSDYTFFYYPDDIKGVVVRNVSVNSLSIKDVLDKILMETGMEYVVEDKVVILSPKKNISEQSIDKKVKGKVVDKNNFTLPGVSIVIKGTNLGVATDIKGEFSIDLPDKKGIVLVFSFIGMKNKEVVWNGQTNLTITMEEEVTKMEEVVVTGIFKKAKESYTGSVSTVTKEKLKMFKGQNLLQTLKNIDVSINLSEDNINGSNPNRLPQINIRGNSSLPSSLKEYNESASNSVNTPLIILDGFEISLERLMDYNDDEIESINVLKDAASTAIYGSRGSNGVIVVVTRKPEAGKLRVNAEVGINIEAPDLSSYDLLNAAEKLDLEKSLGLYNNTVAPSNDVWYKEAYNKRLREVLSGTDTDWLSKPLRTGVGSHYNLRMEGGSEQFRWSATAYYKNVMGAMKDSYRRNFNGSITLMYTVKDFTFKNYTSYGTSQSTESKYGTFSDYVKQQPYNAPYDEYGNLVRFFDGFHKMNSKVQNPLYDATLNSFDKSEYETLTNNFSVEWNPLEGFTVRGQLGISSTDNTGDKFLPAEHSTFTEDDYYMTDEGFLRRGSYDYSTGNSQTYDGNITFSYTKVFNEKHQVYVGLDYSLSESNSLNYGVKAEGFTNEDINFLASARQYAKDDKPSGAKSKSRRFGLTGNLNYVYNNCYYIDFSYRVDGSSTFGSKKKYAPFWSTGIGWNLHNEKFMENSIFNILRIKTSYGQTGTQQGSSTGASTTYGYVTDNRYMYWTGAVLQGWGNPYLTWQKTDELNSGMEFGLLQGRVKGNFNYYTKKTKNLLSYMDLPNSMGFSSYLANVGEVKNKGWEASANGYIIRNTESEIIWMVGGQLTYNKNYISKLSDAIKAQNAEVLKEDVDVSRLFYEGRPQNGIYAVRSLGIDPSTGNEIYLDKDGKRTDIWNASDKVYLGQSDPKYRGNANTMFMWKGLSFNMSFSYYWGGKVYNQTLIDRVEVTSNTLMYQNVDSRVYNDRWQKPGDVISFSKFSNNATRATSRFVMDNNVLELQSIGLQYKCDKSWVKQYAHVSSITFGVNMSDLWYWSTVKMERGTTYPYARNIQGNIKILF